MRPLNSAIPPPNSSFLLFLFLPYTRELIVVHWFLFYRRTISTYPGGELYSSLFTISTWISARVSPKYIGHHPRLIFLRTLDDTYLGSYIALEVSFHFRNYVLADIVRVKELYVSSHHINCLSRFQHLTEAQIFALIPPRAAPII